MARREGLRAQYIEGWNTMNAELLVAAVADDFIFDDPAEPALVTKAGLADYLPTWPRRAAALGAIFDFEITDKVVEDKEGVLTEWYWWRLGGTDVEGSALVKTTDDGVRIERFAYYRSPWPMQR